MSNYTEDEDSEEKREMESLKKEVSRGTYPSDEEMVELYHRRIKGDSTACEKMVVGNIRLAGWYAWLSVGLIDHKQDSVEVFKDLFQEFCIGLMKTADRYNPEKGRFPSHARYQMKAQRQKWFHDNSKTVRINKHAQKKINEIRKAFMELREELGRDPTKEEIAKKVGMKPEKVIQWLMVPTETVSLDKPREFDDGQGDDLLAQTEDQNTLSPDQIMELIDQGNIAAEKLEKLWGYIPKIFHPKTGKRNARMLGCGFGIFGYTSGEKNLDEVGEVFSIKGERVRQIFEKIFITNSVRNFPIHNKKTLRSTVETLRIRIEMYPEGVSDRMLWLAGLE